MTPDLDLYSTAFKRGSDLRPLYAPQCDVLAAYGQYRPG